MRQCIYHNASWQMGNQLKKTPGSIGKDVYCKADYEGCDVLPTAAGMQKSLPVDTPQGYGIPAPRMDVSLGAPFCCEEGWQSKCEGSSMNCRNADAYRKCIGGAGTNVRSDSALAISCADKHCGGDEGGGDGESCRRGCDDMVGQQKTSPTCTMKGYRPPWCTMSVESCKKGCPGGGGVIEPEGCRESAPSLEHVCVKEGGKWTWKLSERKPEPPKNFCKENPNHEKCKKPEPKPIPVTGTLEEKLAALEEIIAGLDDQVAGLRNDLADAKDAVSEKKDEIRALKKSKAPRAEISAAQKELKELKRTASAIVSKGKKLARELKFREKEHARLQRQWPQPLPVY